MSRTTFLDLDFVAAPGATRVGRALLAIGAMAVTASIGVLVLVWTEREDESRRFAAATVASSARTARAPADPALLRAATDLSRDLRMPWGRWLADIEAVQSPDIALLVVEAVPAQNVLRLTADARHAEAMFEFAGRLRQQSGGAVVLTSHQVQPQAPGTPIRFQLQARWPDAAAAAATPPRAVTALAPSQPPHRVQVPAEEQP